MNEIIRYLLRRKMRTALTMFAVAVGIFAVTMVGGITEQMEDLIQLTGNDAQTRISVMTKDYSKPISESAMSVIRRIPGVRGLTVSIVANIAKPEENVATISVNPESFIGTRSDIPGLEFEPPMSGLKLYAGRIPDPGSRTETVVSWGLAQARHLEVGQLLEIRDRAFKIVGIWESEPTVGGRTAYISYEAAEDLLGRDVFIAGGAQVVSVVPQPGADLEAVAKKIETEVSDITATSPKAMVEQARQQVLIFTLIIGASGILSLLIGTFTIVNTMAVSVHERRREIGLKKALGAEDSHILSEVIAEAVLIAGLGGLSGMLVGALCGMLANQALIAQIGSKLFLLTPRLAVGVVAFSTVMGVLAGIYPALQAARLDPVVALRGGSTGGYAAHGLKRLFYLLRRNLRPILTAGGIAIGIFAIAALGSLAEGMNTALNDVTNGTQDMLFLQPEKAGVPMGESTARVLRNFPGVAEVMRFNSRQVPIYFGTDDKEMKEVQIWANNSELGNFSFDMPMDIRVASGRKYAPGSATEMMVGASLAQVNNLHVGDRIRVGQKEREITIVGIWDFVPYDFGGYNTAAYMSINGLVSVTDANSELGALSVRAQPGVSPESFKKLISEELPGLQVQTVTDIFGNLQQVFMTLIAVMAGIFSIAVFVGAVSVINTMVISVKERTWEIGLKKAVGADDGDILAEVLLDAAKLGALGGAVGLVVSWITVILVNIQLQASLGLTMLNLSPRLVLGAFIFSIVLGMVAGILPARTAARLDPAIALHAE